MSLQPTSKLSNLGLIFNTISSLAQIGENTVRDMNNENTRPSYYSNAPIPINSTSINRSSIIRYLINIDIQGENDMNNRSFVKSFVGTDTVPCSKVIEVNGIGIKVNIDIKYRNVVEENILIIVTDPSSRASFDYAKSVISSIRQYDENKTIALVNKLGRNRIVSVSEEEYQNYAYHFNVKSYTVIGDTNVEYIFKDIAESHLSTKF